MMSNNIPIEEGDDGIVAGEHVEEELCFDVLVVCGGLLWQWDGIAHCYEAYCYLLL